jgi:predicted DNA-binding transcriptional regulator AlpA
MSATERNTATLHETGYVRQSQLVGRKGSPGIIPFSPATLWRKVAAGQFPAPVSPATLWRKVAAGQFPAPVKLSAGVTAWRVEDVRAWLDTPR